MKKSDTIVRHTAAEVEAMRVAGQSQTDWRKVDATTDEELEQRIAEDDGERGLDPDWTRARLIMPVPRQSVHLRLDREVIDFFKSGGKGHIRRMQAVLKAYVDAHRRERT